MDKVEILKGYLDDPSTIPADVLEAMLDEGTKRFYEAVDNFPPGMLAFCANARRKALDLYMKDVEDIINSDMNPTDLTFEDFNSVICTPESEILNLDKTLVRNCAAAMVSALLLVIERNRKECGYVDVTGQLYGNLITPNFSVQSGSFMTSAAESLCDWQALVAPALSRYHQKYPDRTYAVASERLFRFFQGPIGKVIGEGLVSQAIDSGEEDPMAYMQFFCGENSSLADGYNVDMPQRLERLIDLTTDLWRAASDPSLGFKMKDSDALAGLDELNRILDLLIDAEPYSLHLQFTAESTNRPMGGHFSKSENELTVFGPFESKRMSKRSSFFSTEGGETFFGEVVHHELTHALEYLKVPDLYVKGSMDYSLNMASLALIYSRIKPGDKLEFMKEYSGFCVGFRDSFPFSYVGRLYTTPGLTLDTSAEITDVVGIESSEALATTIGNMQSPASCFSGFITDEEHFSHALAVFYGTYLVK